VDPPRDGLVPPTMNSPVWASITVLSDSIGSGAGGMG
jgi:hypothetical protein